MAEPLFARHFSRAEATQWIAKLRQELPALAELVERIGPDLARLRPVVERRGNGGGIDVVRYVAVDEELASILQPIQEAGIVLKDVQRGLVDFPHLLPDGSEVFLCWELRDPDRIEWYHELDAGYAGRRRLPPAHST
jgi:hypothetical protein